MILQEPSVLTVRSEGRTQGQKAGRCPDFSGILQSGAVLTFTVVPKGGCSVASVTNTEERALCVPALSITAEMMVPTLINIYRARQ